MLKNQRTALLKRANQIVQDAKSAGRDMTDTENTEVQGIIKSIQDHDAEAQATVHAAADRSADLMKSFEALGTTEQGGDGYEDRYGDGTPLGRQGAGGIGPKAWAEHAVKAIRRAGGEKSVVSGSITMPAVVLEAVSGPVAAHNLLQLIPSAPVAQNNFGYLRTTARTNNAAPVPDHGLKPTSIFTFEEIEDRCRVIAHLSEPFPQRFLQDHTEAVNLLQYEMAAGVLAAIEQQVIAGDGSGENLTGILNATGVNDVAFTSDIPTTLRRARTRLAILEETPTAWVFNPQDAETLDLLREDGDTGGFLALDRILGDVPWVTSPALPAGTALLGDWRQVGILVREGARMDVNTNSGDLFDRNEVKLRAEQRVGLAVRRPQALAIVHLSA